MLQLEGYETLIRDRCAIKGIYTGKGVIFIQYTSLASCVGEAGRTVRSYQLGHPPHQSRKLWDEQQHKGILRTGDSYDDEDVGGA